MTAIVEKNEFLISILPLLHIGFHPQSRAVGLVEHVQHKAQINGPALHKASHKQTALLENRPQRDIDLPQYGILIGSSL